MTSTFQEVPRLRSPHQMAMELRSGTCCDVLGTCLLTDSMTVFGNCCPEALFSPVPSSALTQVSPTPLLAMSLPELFVHLLFNYKHCHMLYAVYLLKTQKRSKKMFSIDWIGLHCSYFSTIEWVCLKNICLVPFEYNIHMYLHIIYIYTCVCVIYVHVLTWNCVTFYHVYQQ